MEQCLCRFGRTGVSVANLRTHVVDNLDVVVLAVLPPCAEPFRGRSLVAPGVFFHSLPKGFRLAAVSTHRRSDSPLQQIVPSFPRPLHQVLYRMYEPQPLVSRVRAIIVQIEQSVPAPHQPIWRIHQVGLLSCRRKE